MKFYTRFEDLNRDMITVVTHRLSSMKMVQNILLLKAGRMIEAGTNNELLGKLENLHAYSECRPNGIHDGTTKKARWVSG